MRKLEFLIADAKERGHDGVITLGGIQSNHCRATAVAARYNIKLWGSPTALRSSLTMPCTLSS